MKLAFDVHGVLDAENPVWREMLRLFKQAGHTCHVMTGMSAERIVPELEILGIFEDDYDELWSITDEAIKAGVDVTFDENGEPWLDEEWWDSFKGRKCAELGIDLLIDNSRAYMPHMDGTTFALVRDF